MVSPVLSPLVVGGWLAFVEIVVDKLVADVDVVVGSIGGICSIGGAVVPDVADGGDGFWGCRLAASWFSARISSWSSCSAWPLGSSSS